MHKFVGVLDNPRHLAHIQTSFFCCYQEAYVRSKLMLGGAGEDQEEALSQAKTAQIQGIMKLFAVSL